jgi:hypothetical protein
MSDTELLALLRSNSLRDVEDGLRKLGLLVKDGLLEQRPPEEVFTLAKHYLTHQDEDLRYEAIVAVAYYWVEKDVFPLLLSLVQSEASTHVLGVIVRAICNQGALYHEFKSQALKTLSGLVCNQRLGPEIRGLAYAECLHMTRRISANDYARLPKDINQIAVDWEWIATLSAE